MDFSGWKECRLGDVCLLGDGAHTKVKRVESGIPYLTSKNIKGGYINLEKIDYICEEDYQRLFGESQKSVRHLQEEDVLVGIIGTLGNCYQYKKSDRFGISSSIGILRPNKELLYPEYLYHIVSSKRFLNLIQSVKGGSVQAYTNLPTLRNVPITLPPIEEQKSIANILSTLDEKIEVNNQINKTLETMAQAIFKQWFVDFEFPNEDGEPYKSSGGKMVESELGMIPEGWEIASLATLGRIVTGKTPSTKIIENFGDKYNFITPRDINDSIYILKSERLLSEYGTEKLEKNKIKINSIGVSCIGSNLGEVYLNAEEGFTNQQINTLIPFREDLYPYIFIVLKNIKEDFLNMAGGSAVPIINKTAFSVIKIIMPSEIILDNYLKSVTNIFDSIKNNLIQNKNLIEIRDISLPKLMSGEIRVPLDN